MPQQNVARLAFNRGQVSPLALARTDIDRVELSAEEQTNFMPRVLGSMMLRPGLKYVDTTLSNNYAQHLPFVFSLEDKALIEFTNMSMRVRVDDAIIERPAVSTVTRGGDFSSEDPATAFTKITNPSDLAISQNTDCAFSPDGSCLATVASSGTTTRLYTFSGTTATQSDTHGTAGGATGVAWSPDGTVLTVTHGVSPYVDNLPVTGTGTVGAALTALGTTPAGTARCPAWSPDGTMLAIAHDTTPFVSIYTYTAPATWTKLSDPSSLPAGAGLGAAWSTDGRFLAIAHDTTPFVTIYEVNGTTFTKLSNPASLPAGAGRSVAFTRDGLHMAVAHDTTPFVTIYSIDGTTFTKLSNPSTLPDGNGQAVAFSTDNQFMSVAHATSQFATIYRYVSGVWTKQTDPVTVPTGIGEATCWSPNNRFMVIGHQTTPFVSIYEAYNWLDMDGSGATSSYNGASTGSWVTASNWASNDGAAGSSFQTHTVRMIINGSALTRSGSKVRITMETTSATSVTLQKCYIGQQASSGDTYDFASAPTQITWDGGSSGFTGDINAGKVSDEITFAIDETLNYIIAFRFTSVAGTNLVSETSTSNQTQVYYKAAVDDVTTVNATGYTLWSEDVVAITLVEVFETTAGSGTPGLSLVGTLYNDAKRVQAVSVIDADVDVEHALNVVVSQGEIKFRVGSEYGEDDLISETKLTEGYHSLAFTPTTNLFFIQISANTQYTTVVAQCQVAGSGDMTLDTIYGEEDIGSLRYTQSADVVYIACRDEPPYKIERRGTNSWSFVKYLPPDGPFRSLNADSTTLTPSALSGDITVTASKDVFKEEHVGSLFKITSAGQNTDDDFTGANQFSATNVRVTGSGTQRSITIVRSGTWSATITLQRSAAEPGSWVDVATFTTNGTTIYTDDLDEQIYYYRIGIKTGNYTSGTAAVQLTYASGGIDGVVRVTGFTSRTVVDAIVLKLLGNTSGSENWKEGLWSDVRGYPTAVAIHEGRLCWSGKDRVVLTVSDSYESFDEETEGDSGPINRTIGLGPVDQINWVISSKTLVLGGQDSEFSIGTTSFDEVLTPSNFHADPVTNVGSCDVMAAKLDKAIIFTSRTGTKLYQLSYDSSIYDYVVKDLSRLVPELCEAQIVKLFYQRYPDTRVHCVLADGTVAVMVYEQEEQVNCWLTIETDGIIEDCVTLPGDIGVPEDQVYYVVQRTINGETVRYLERWALESECEGGTQNWQLDAAVEYSGAPTATLTGLDHLEGETVRVWGDGSYQGSFTVSSGAITINASVSAAVIGLTYTGRYKSTKLAYAAKQGTALTRLKKVSQFGLILQNTAQGDTANARGPRFGTHFDHLRNLPSEGPDGDFVDETYIHDQSDLDMFTIADTWSTDSRLCVEVDAPYPITLLCITFSMETNG
jgi:hypothetical protein